MAITRPSLAFRAFAQTVVADFEKVHAELIKDNKIASNPTIVNLGKKLEGFSAAVKRLNYFDKSEQKRNEFNLKKQTRENCSLAEAKTAVLRLQALKVDDRVKKKYADQKEKIESQLNPPEPGIFDYVADFANQFADNFDLRDKSKPKTAPAVVQDNKKTKEQLEAELKAVENKIAEEQKAFLLQIERECTGTLDQINRRIELQKQLFFAGISQQMMFDCLSVYACFMELGNIDLEDYFAIGVKEFKVCKDKHAQQMAEIFKPLWCPMIGNKSAMEVYEQYKKFDEVTKKIVLDGSAANIDKVIPKTKAPFLSLLDVRNKLVEVPAVLKANQITGFVSWMYGRAVSAFTPTAVIVAPAALPRPSA